MVLSFSAALPLALHVPYMLIDGPIHPPSALSMMAAGLTVIVSDLLPLL